MNRTYAPVVGVVALTEVVGLVLGDRSLGGC